MSAITRIGDLEIEDPGCVHHIREHLASGCPLEPLVEAVVPMDPEERAPLVAAMVAKANHLIAARNEAANDAQFPDMSRNSEDEPKRGRGRPRSVVATERKELAEKAGVNERTIRRDAAKLEPAEPIVTPPPKVKPIEERLGEYAVQLDTLRALIYGCTQEMEALAVQLDWSRTDVRRRIIQDVARELSRVASAAIGLKELSDRMAKAKVKVFTAPTRKLGDKPAPGPGARERPLQANIEDRIASGGGLRAPSRLRVETPDGKLLAVGVTEEERETYETADAVGLGGGDPEEGAF